MSDRPQTRPFSNSSTRTQTLDALSCLVVDQSITPSDGAEETAASPTPNAVPSDIPKSLFFATKSSRIGPFPALKKRGNPADPTTHPRSTPDTCPLIPSSLLSRPTPVSAKMLTRLQTVRCRQMLGAVCGACRLLGKARLNRPAKPKQVLFVLNVTRDNVNGPSGSTKKKEQKISALKTPARADSGIVANGEGRRRFHGPACRPKIWDRVIARASLLRL